MAQTPPQSPKPLLGTTDSYHDTARQAANLTPAHGGRGFLVLSEGEVPVEGYALEERLGRGGFGEVWRALGPGGFRVAMKFISLEGRSGRLEKRSLELMRQIQHPHLLAMFGAWEKDNTLIIAMELGRCTLLQRLHETRDQGWLGIPPTELLEHMRDAARGIDYLNEPVHKLGDGPPQGIQHRDIKPQNLLLVGNGLKVADFGLARLLEQSVMDVSGSMTPAYAAPEQFNSKASRWSDQYSLAITYCHLRTNALPFSGTAAQIVAGHLTKQPDLTILPDPERPIVARALAKEPAQRWPNCRAFVDALAEVMQGAGKKKSSTVIELPTERPAAPAPEPAVKFKAVDEEFHRFTCPKCGQQLRIQSVNLNRRMRCTACKTLIQAQVPGQPPPDPRGSGPVARVPVVPQRLPVPPDQMSLDELPVHERGGVSFLRRFITFLCGLLLVVTSAALSLLVLWAVFLWWRHGTWPGMG